MKEDFLDKMWDILHSVLQESYVAHELQVKHNLEIQNSVLRLREIGAQIGAEVAQRLREHGR